MNFSRETFWTSEGKDKKTATKGMAAVCWVFLKN